jgi:hypothetical protein
VTGPAGAGATGAGGPTGGAGPTGPTGGQGNAGVNVFHMVTSAPISVDGTVVAECPPGEVVTGGGFTGTPLAITDSRPSNTGTGWFVEVDSDGSPVTANAVCVAGTIS